MREEQNDFNEYYSDRVNDLELRVDMLERYVSELRNQINDIHPVQYNIVAKEEIDA